MQKAGLYTCPEAVLSLFDVNHSHTGVVIQVGASYTSVVPVYYGHSIRHAIQTTPVGGKALSDYLKQNLPWGDYRHELGRADDRSVPLPFFKMCYRSNSLRCKSGFVDLVKTGQKSVPPVLFPDGAVSDPFEYVLQPDQQE